MEYRVQLIAKYIRSATITSIWWHVVFGAAIMCCTRSPSGIKPWDARVFPKDSVLPSNTSIEDCGHLGYDTNSIRDTRCAELRKKTQQRLRKSIRFSDLLLFSRTLAPLTSQVSQPLNDFRQWSNPEVVDGTVKNPDLRKSSVHQPPYCLVGYTQER